MSNSCHMLRGDVARMPHKCCMRILAMRLSDMLTYCKKRCLAVSFCWQGARKAACRAVLVNQRWAGCDCSACRNCTKCNAKTAGVYRQGQTVQTEVRVDRSSASFGSDAVCMQSAGNIRLFGVLGPPQGQVCVQQQDWFAAQSVRQVRLEAKQWSLCKFLSTEMRNFS